MSTFFSLEQRNKPLDVTCIENALVDLLFEISDVQLQELSASGKGTMSLVTSTEQEALLAALGREPSMMSLGGSASNVVRGLSSLKMKTCLSSAVGDDDLGTQFEREILDLNVHACLQRVKNKMTGSCLILVTPDGERTMKTSLGACLSYSCDAIPFDMIRQSKIFFSSGYMLDTQTQRDVLQASIDFSLLNNVKIAFDLGDSLVVQRHGTSTILDIISKSHVVFANSAESLALFGLSGEAGARELGKYVDVAIVKDGSRGSFLCHNEQVFYIPASPVEVIDTTGAGDMYAAGFLYGVSRGYSLKVGCEIGSFLAADTVSRMGASFSGEICSEVLKRYPEVKR